ncbi:MAG: hypothetical protein WDO14_24460 [Bacteroidota bacterium]
MKKLYPTLFLLLSFTATLAQDIDTDRLKRMRDSLDNILMVNPTSSAILVRRSEIELYSFNTMMSSKTFNDREGKDSFLPGKYSLFSSLLQVNYGLSKSRRINIGADFSYRSYRFDVDKGTSSLKVLGGDAGNVKALNYAGLRVRVVPFKKLRNFIWQSYLWFPTASKDVRYSLGSSKMNFGNTLFFYKYLTPRIGMFLQANMTFAFASSPTNPDGTKSFTELYLPVSGSLSYVVSPKNIVYGSLIYSWVNDDARNFFEGADHDFAQFSLGYQRIISKRFFANINYTGTLFARNYGEWNSFSFGVRYLY